MQGWIKLHRKIQEHWVYTNAEYYKAWSTILFQCNHSDQKVLIKGVLIDCKRGQSLNSLDTWVRIFKSDFWNKSKFRRFLKLLEKDNMIVLKSNPKTTHLSVCNYGSYQGERNADETQTKRKRNADETQTTLNNNDKNEYNDKNDKNKEREIQFNDFWNFYNKKKGSKQDAKKAFMRLTDSEVNKIKETLPSFLRSVSDKQFLPYPIRYITKKRWNDEISDKEIIDGMSPEEKSRYLIEKNQKELKEFFNEKENA